MFAFFFFLALNQFQVPSRPGITRSNYLLPFFSRDTAQIDRVFVRAEVGSKLIPWLDIMFTKQKL